MNYKPSPLQVKLGECVWGRRAMWEVNKMLSGWVYSKVLQLKYLRLDGSKTKPPRHLMSFKTKKAVMFAAGS